MTVTALFCFAMLTGGGAPCAAQTTLEGGGFRAVVDSNARWTSLRRSGSSRELCAVQAKLPFASIQVDGKSRNASGMRRLGERLEVAFGQSGVKLTYGVERTDDWLRLTLERVAGPRPQRVTLMQVPATITENVGYRLGIAWDADTSVCLMAGNQQTGSGAARRKGYALLRATTQDGPGPKLEGASVALIVCPTKRIRQALQMIAKSPLCSARSVADKTAVVCRSTSSRPFGKRVRTAFC